MEISDFTKIVQDLGIYSVVMITMIVLGFKYVPKFLDLKLKRSQEKDYMMDSFKAVIENNTSVVNNNSEVIKQNTITIKNYTDNAHKLENKVDELTKVISNVDTDIKILKERRK